MSLYRDRAVVLHAWKLGEADRIVSLHTHDHGKVRAVAKGVRRTRSRFGSRLEPTNLVAVQLYRGRGELDTVTQVETLDRHLVLRRDPDRFARASVLLEAVEQVAQDREPDPELHVMLARALRTLDRHDSAVVVGAFLFKVLVHEGLGPELDHCVSCGSTGPFEAFDPGHGGVLCRDCRFGRPLGGEALALIRAVLSGGLGALLDRPPDAATAEFEALATQAFEHHIER
ncbi:MAG: DNA repair protein RecO, partial [Actinomyces sp.]